MNWAEIEENWPVMCSVLQSYWPLLSRDDVAAIDRSRTRLVSTLQKVYKLNETDAESSVRAFGKTVRKPGAN
jgi:hypothetical protein